MQYTLTIPEWQPTRLNQLLHCHWGTAARRKRQDRDIVTLYARMAQIPAATTRRRVALTIVLEPRQRAGDPDAYFKSLLDACVHAQLLKQDSPKWCELGEVRFERGRHRETRIHLTDMEEA